MRIQSANELDIFVDPESRQPLYAQIYDALKGKISSGVLRPGEKLPSIRSLCDSLGVSHITVEKAYTQLSAEGYIDASPRSGYTVKYVDADWLSRDALHVGEDVASVMQDYRAHTTFLGHQLQQPPRYDFACCDLAPGSFPRKEWRRLSSEVLQSRDEQFMTAYDNTLNPNSLQMALQAYLARARGVVCQPEQILVAPGTIPGLFSILSLFDPANDLLGQENPGYGGIDQAAKRLGFKCCSLPVSADWEAYFGNLAECRPNIIFVTPSNQFPTGLVMPLQERIRLLEYAARNDAYIIEDDVCSEYRYKTQPVPSLKSLDKEDRVIYVNSFGKTLSPSLRVAYVVLPPQLLKKHLASFFSGFSYVDGLTQETLALFIERGLFDQQLKRMRLANSVRHDRLLDCLQDRLGGRVEISGDDSGMHLFVTVHNFMTLRELVESAAACDVGVHSDYTLSSAAEEKKSDNAVILGFSRIDVEDIEPGIAALERAWF